MCVVCVYYVVCVNVCVCECMCVWYVWCAMCGVHIYVRVFMCSKYVCSVCDCVLMCVVCVVYSVSVVCISMYMCLCVLNKMNT